MSVKLAFAMIAQHALAHNDGRFYITGGGWDRVTADRLPTVIPHMSLALQLQFTHDEIGHEHVLAIVGVGPNDVPFLEGVELPIRVAPAATSPSGGILINCVYNMSSLSLQSAGLHRLVISVGEARAERLFDVSLSSKAVPIPEVESLLEAGFALFSEGKLTEAKQVFEGILAQHPDNASAHNNLGFVLLSEGRASDALEEFHHARRRGFSYPELMQVNVACCHYLRGNYAAALEAFEGCFANRLTPAAAFLTGISDGALFTAYLSSAADYTWLLALNAGWAAFRVADMEEATANLAMAQGKIYRGATDDEPFKQSVGLLAQSIESASSPG